MSLELEAKRTAVVLIDLEHIIVARDTKPYAAMDVVERCAGIAEAARAAGSKVFYVHVALSQFKKTLADQPTQVPDQLPPHAEELVPEAGYNAETDVLVTKYQWDAFWGTDLQVRLQQASVDTVVIGGIATNIGVESTARSAFANGYNVVIAEDACATFSAEWHDFAVKNIFPRLGRVRSSNEVIRALNG